MQLLETSMGHYGPPCRLLKVIERISGNKLGREMQGLESISGMKIKAASEQKSGEEKLGRYRITTAWGPTDVYHPSGKMGCVQKGR